MDIEKVFREAGVVPGGLLIGLIHAALEDQRERITDAVIKELKSIGFQLYELGEKRIKDACLNIDVKN